MSSNNPNPPQKRQRTDGNEPQEGVILTRSKFWFDDGNIVLQTKDMQFRVYRGILSLNSSVFKDMFSMPQPLHSEDAMIEGCPIVPVSDSSQDLEIVLSIIFDKSNLSLLGLFTKIPFVSVAAMLRLGTKYEIEYMKQAALDILRHDSPTTLTAWDKLDVENLRLDVLETEEVFLLIDLALAFSLCSILPTAYLHSLQNFSTLNELIKHGGQFPEIFSECVNGREKMIFFLNDLHLSWSHRVIKKEFNQKCRKNPQCVPENRKVVLDQFPVWPNDKSHFIVGINDHGHDPRSDLVCSGARRH